MFDCVENEHNFFFHGHHAPTSLPLLRVPQCQHGATCPVRTSTAAAGVTVTQLDEVVSCHTCGRSE